MTTTKMLPFVLFCLLCLASFATAPAALADYYKYTDSRGGISITNNLDSVPAKYRSTMKVVRESPQKDAGAGNQLQQPQPEPEAAAPEQTGAAAPAEAPTGKFAELSARFPWFKPLVYVGIFLATFVVMIKVTALLPSPLLAKVIYLAFFLGVFVFLYKAYVAHVVESTAKIKEKAAIMMKNSTVRELPQPEGDAAAPAAK